jgi:regulator of PEP synthase PpsR (kinase-PPPase family)
MTQRDQINLHLVSDATGETLNSLARACLAQFPDHSVIYHRWNLIRHRFQLDPVMRGIELEPGPVLFTLVDQALRDDLQLFCGKLNLPYLSVLDPAMDFFTRCFGHRGSAKPGAQFVMDNDYFKRIDAMHYMFAHDDGQAPGGLAEAEVILIGVSRSSKTPTCFELARRGVKAANVPFVPGTPLPAILDDPKVPVVGLTIDIRKLLDIRQSRLDLIAKSGVQIRVNESDYIDPEKVKEELTAVRRLCARRGWPTIDVTRRASEETAATVLQMMENWRQRRQRAAVAAEPA